MHKLKENALESLKTSTKDQDLKTKYIYRSEKSYTNI